MKGDSVVPSSTPYSLPPSEETARPGVVGSCSIIAGNRVCNAAPAQRVRLRIRLRLRRWRAARRSGRRAVRQRPAPWPRRLSRPPAAITGAPYAPAPGPYAGPPPNARYRGAPPPREGQVGCPVLDCLYSLPPSAETARPGVVGSCSIIAGNRVCSASASHPVSLSLSRRNEGAGGPPAPAFAAGHGAPRLHISRKGTKDLETRCFAEPIEATAVRACVESKVSAVVARAAHLPPGNGTKVREFLLRAAVSGAFVGRPRIAARAHARKEGVMRLAVFGAALSTALLSASCANAQDAGVFDKWLSQDAPQCVPVSEFKAVSTVTELTPAQFQFVRALYVALPPVSRKLPPGRPCCHGDRRRVRDACAGRRRGGLRPVSRPGLHPVDADPGRRGPERTCRPAGELAPRSRLVHRGAIFG